MILIRCGTTYKLGLRRFITKCDRYYYKIRQPFYYNMRRNFMAKCVRFFTAKCDSFITKYDSYYKMRRFCYKMRQLLQNVAFITQIAAVQ